MSTSTDRTGGLLDPSDFDRGELLWMNPREMSVTYLPDGLHNLDDRGRAFVRALCELTIRKLDEQAEEA